MLTYSLGFPMEFPRGLFGVMGLLIVGASYSIMTERPCWFILNGFSVLPCPSTSLLIPPLLVFVETRVDLSMGRELSIIPLRFSLAWIIEKTPCNKGKVSFPKTCTWTCSNSILSSAKNLKILSLSIFYKKKKKENPFPFYKH